MENKERPLLSICIPTYNGANRISSTLKYLFEGVYLCDHLIEIIVADNHSEDDTELILKSISSNKDNIKFGYVRYDENIGYNYSIINILKNLANGEYIWLIGDDDFVIPSSLPFICSVLNSRSFDYVHLNHLVIKKEEEIGAFIDVKEYLFREGEMNSVIDNNAKYSDLMATFMSSSIGKLDVIKQVNFGVFNKESWSDFRSVFPVSYIMVSCFAKLKCAEIITPSIICVQHEKNWDDKLNVMKLQYLPDLLVEYEKRGLDLPNNKFLIAKGMVYSIFTNPLNIKYVKICHYSFLFQKKVFKEICKRIKRIL